MQCLIFVGQDESLRVSEKEKDTKDNQLQGDRIERRTSKELPSNNIQIHPEIGVIDDTKHMPTERTWQDMWPKNDKQHDDDENADVVVCKKATKEKSIEEMTEIEQERTWNDMWP